jgi:predicted glycoside hydrolase/deacetylase ChbG (UPF0249 family)
MPSLLYPGTEEFFVDTPAQRAALLAAAKLTEVVRELRAQIDAVVEVGITPTHLDWHCLADAGRADIFDLTMALAEEDGLAARVWLDDGRRKARRQGKRRRAIATGVEPRWRTLTCAVVRKCPLGLDALSVRRRLR